MKTDVLYKSFFTVYKPMETKVLLTWIKNSEKC